MLVRSVKRCFWDFQNIEGTAYLCFRCSFDGLDYSLAEKMQLLYCAAAELAKELVLQGLECFLGVGPIDNNLESETWQIVVIPNGGARNEALVETLWSFERKLNNTRDLHQPMTAPTVSPPSKLPQKNTN